MANSSIQLNLSFILSLMNIACLFSFGARVEVRVETARHRKVVRFMHGERSPQP